MKLLEVVVVVNPSSPTNGRNEKQLDKPPGSGWTLTGVLQHLDTQKLLIERIRLLAHCFSEYLWYRLPCNMFVMLWRVLK